MKSKINIVNGQLSRYIYHKRLRLVEKNLASWYMPYKSLEEIEGMEL